MDPAGTFAEADIKLESATEMEAAGGSEVAAVPRAATGRGAAMGSKVAAV